MTADSNSNALIVLGPAVTNWQGLDLARVPMRLRLDGTEVKTIDQGPSTENVLASLAWLANHAAARHGGLARPGVGCAQPASRLRRQVLIPRNTRGALRRAQRPAGLRGIGRCDDAAQ